MKLIIDIPEEGFNACKLWVEMGAASWQDKVITNGIPYEKECIIEELAKSKNEERPQGELKEYKPLEPDYNVQCAVENLRTAYWSNDTEKYAKAFTEADQMIVSAICHYGYIVVKGGAENG